MRRFTTIPPAFRRSRGFTLIEVLMAVVIIGILASVALRSVTSGIESSRYRATQDEMAELAWAIAGNPDLFANGMRSDFGYVGDVGAVPSSLDDLVSNPGGYATWNGPYISRKFTQDADGFKQDAWGNDYTFTSGITIASTGNGSQPMTKSVAQAATDLTQTPIVGSVTDAAGNPPGDSAVAITITASYPDGAGGMTAATVSPSTGGAYTISNIPIGIRVVEAVYRATNDTVTLYACILPRDGATVSFRLPGAPFAASGGGGGGGGGGAGTIAYVPGSASNSGGGENIQFSITNTGGTDITITSLVATYSGALYYKRVRWNSASVFNEESPRAGSGDTANFSNSKTIAPGETVVIDLQGFKDAPTGGSDADASNTDFTITFSDGSVITFNSGP